MANIPVIAEINTLLDANDVTIAKAALGVLGAAVKGTGDIVNADINAGAAIALSKLATGALPTAITVASANLATSAVDLTTSTVTGTLPVNKGGTGVATLTANNVLIGAGTSTPTFVAPSTAGNVLTSNGTTWVSSGGSTPTNATVNAAINIDPAETRYALSAERKQNFGAAIQNLRGQTSKNLRVVTFGDSLVAQGTPLNLSGVIPSAGGFCEAGVSINVSGTTALVNDWMYPGGQHVSISTGGTRRWGKEYITPSAHPFNHASIFKIFYIRGVGTLRLRGEPSLSGTFTNLPGHEAISTDTGTAGTIGVYTVTLTAATTNTVPSANFWRIDTVCDSGTVKILCVQALANTTGSRDSYHLSCLGLGGSDDSQWINCLPENWTAVLTEMNPHLIVFKAADFHIANKTTAGNWATVLTRIRNAAPKAVMLLIDNHPWSGNTDPAVDNSGWSDGLKAYAAANAPMVQFVECRKFWPNYDDMVALGFIPILDGIHLQDPQGRVFESALVLDHVSTLTVAPHINEILSTKIFSRLAGVIGTVKSAYLSGPEWGVTGDLNNANGYIGMFNQLGTGAQPNQGPHLTAFSKASTAKTSGGLAFGLDRTSHQILVQSRVNNRVIVGNLGNTETLLTRDSNAQLEVLGTLATVPTFSVGAVASQTADMVEFRTSSSVTAAGTKVSGVRFDGIPFLASFDTTARNSLTSVPAGSVIFNTTTSKLNFYTGVAWEAVTSS